MTDAEAKQALLKIVYDFEAAGLSFASLLAKAQKPGWIAPPGPCVPPKRLLKIR